VSGTSAEAASAYARLALGCPSMGDEVLEESEFEPFFAELEGKLAGKKVALFGSYGWGDGQWMRDWVARAKAAEAQVFGDGLTAQGEPDEDACVGYGSAFTVF
ncbi:MAG TPA: flavodoxin, partial [Clostridia bacterium]|nr:flavodoxin [Clostridia bacterium]